MMISKSVFISRFVYSNSPLCIDANYNLVAKSLIKFESFPVTTFPRADWYFFYSRNGVYFGLRQLEDRSFLDDIKIATMGHGTAKQFEDMTDRTPDFIGSGDADHVSTEFIKVAEQQKVVYIRAENSLKSIQENLKDKLDGSDLVTYKNYVNESVSITPTDIAIFTSPMNVDAYFKKITPSTTATYIALGKSTKRAITKYTDRNILMPKEPNEASIKVLIDSLLAY